MLVRRLGLIEVINQRVPLPKLHLHYHESDHVLTIAYNVLCGGTCLQDLELRRQDEVFPNAVGAQRISDPTTAGDFCRRFNAAAIHALFGAFDATRWGVWAQQPAAFFNQLVVDMDGNIVETDGACKQGMDLSYDGRWGYRPLLVSLANTGEVLRIVNRSGNRPSHEDAGDQGAEGLFWRRLSARVA